MEEFHDSFKRHRVDVFMPLSTRKKQRSIEKAGFFYLRSLASPLISSTTNSPLKSVCLRSDRLYTIGRDYRYCNFVFNDRRVSKKHCQIFLDGSERKIFILDGIFLPFSSDLNKLRSYFRSRLDSEEAQVGVEVRPSVNGVFVNGCRLGEGTVMELSAGDEVSFVCGNELDPSFRSKIGFVLERVVFVEEVLGLNETVFRHGFREAKSKITSLEGQGRTRKEKLLGLNDYGIDKNFRFCSSDSENLIARAGFLLEQCTSILHSLDPISYIRRQVNLNSKNKISRTQNGRYLMDEENKLSERVTKENTNVNNSVLATEVHHTHALVSVPNHHFQQNYFKGISAENCEEDCLKKGLTLNSTRKFDQADSLHHKKNLCKLCSTSGKKFYLNRLDFMDHSAVDQERVVSLPELLYPVECLLRMFIATFTSDISWFLSYCGIPSSLPVTIACHDTERCWSPSPDKRTSKPYSDYPNLVVVYPPFPEDVAFGKDHKKQGVACHHPKLLVLQKKDSIRVIITSANLVSKQWNNVTNTVWWQDFPLRSLPDYSSLFTSASEGKTFASDFAAHLSGFMASLLIDVPSQAHWIAELTKYDFGGAVGHLVASVPGMHMKLSTCPLKPMYFLPDNCCKLQSIGMKFLGFVEASLVGLKHQFHTLADPNGAQLKMLAAFLGKCPENAVGMVEVLLRRNFTIPIDPNAVTVLVGDLDEFSEGDCILLGFLPRNIAKWVAPLCDAGFFSFSAYVYPKEVLAAALRESNSKVQLILYVSQGPNFFKISSLMQSEHVAALCSLIASMHRCVGLWRLQELLGPYHWPEELETDFIYGSSSIGTSVNSHFLAAFSAAAGKMSVKFSDSEESDPEWGKWNASQELKDPSMRIIFPTIERVKDASCGVQPYRRLLCLSEKTWQRLRSMGIFHDAIPHPHCRVGYPMHSKVARRRFQSKTESSSFGWVYCGSHNLSPAAWGLPVAPVLNADRAPEAPSLFGSRLRLCNYELGILFIVPPLNKSEDTKQRSNLDDIILPFVLPPPKYQPMDRPATAQAMRGALVELAKLDEDSFQEQEAAGELMDEEIPDEEVIEVTEYVAEEKADDKAYADMIWSQINSSAS